MLKNRNNKPSIVFLILIITFTLLQVLIVILNNNTFDIRLGNLIFKATALSSTITQIQVLNLICLVIFFDKSGYISTIILCLLSALINFIIILHTGDLNALTGIFIALSALINTSIIYTYGSRFKQKVIETLKQKESLNKIAWFDSLTGLPNRRKVLETLEEMILNPDINYFGVVFIDIDNFKKINDTAGHEKGDKILTQVVHCLKDNLRFGDFLGRLGGDEFCLIVRSTENTEELLKYLTNLKEILLNRMNSKTNPFYVSASFGVAVYPNDATSTDQLLKYADTAMYATKATGKNGVKYFTSEMHESLMRKILLEHHLQNALYNQEFSLVYQPQYTSSSHKLRGFEALLRWSSPELGHISPATFIPIAEETGLIIPIGEWVLRTACETFKKLMELYHMELTLSVNISVIQVLEPNFLSTIKKVLEETHFPTCCLELEVTESIFISSKDYVVNLLNTLKQMGIHIALDDFGTTYASLSYLQVLPLDVIKIDKSFVDPIVNNKKQENLVHAIITIAQELEYKVVAEGIENNGQLSLLQAHGCDYIQGYLLGKPLSFQDLNLLLSKIAI